MLYFNVDKEAFGDFVPQTPYQGSALDLAEASQTSCYVPSTMSPNCGNR